MLEIAVALLAFAVIVAVVVLLPRRYMMVRVDPETIAEALRARLSKDEIKMLALELIAGLD